MPDRFDIVALPNNLFRAEKLVINDHGTKYQSATFHTRQEARDWIERQGKPSIILQIDYIITSTDAGTHCVTLVRSDREAHEVLGEFSTLDEAKQFIQRMRELDAAPTHGTDRPKKPDDETRRWPVANLRPNESAFLATLGPRRTARWLVGP